MATPIQKRVMLTGLSISAMPPTTNPTIATVTAVQAAGVLPWWAIWAPASFGPARSRDSLGVGRAPGREGGVASLVHRPPQVQARLLPGRSRGGARGVVLRPHRRPGRRVPDGGGRREHREHGR